MVSEEPGESMKKSKQVKLLRMAIFCVRDSYQNHKGHLQNEELKMIPELDAERDQIIEAIREAIDKK